MGDKEKNNCGQRMYTAQAYLNVVCANADVSGNENS